MAESMSGYRTVGDYTMGKQIGAGSFSTVWHARHRVNGAEVAVKEIVTSRLNSKLQESLKSEIYILKRIDHPNIIRLLDMIEESGKIYIILEYCKGGDLSVFIRQRNGKVSEETAKHFMLQLAEGLKVLRENNLIHRDLKPQNLLLSSNGDDSVLKIADFGFARSLQPRGLAETLCGSPLYMAPEIMQLQKYDAKADLWSVGAILFQLVTGKTPFTGSNQIELLQNIIKSTELKFPPEAVDLNPRCMDLCRKLLRRDPVERLTFEEFFNHAYLSQRQPDEFLRQSNRVLDGFPLPKRNTKQTSDSSGPTVKPLYGFSLDTNLDRKGISSPANKTEMKGSSIRGHQLSEGNLKTSLNNANLGLLDTSAKVVDSLESIDQDYVIVSGSVMDLQSSELPKSTSRSPSKTDTKPCYSGIVDPTPINQSATGRFETSDSLDQPSIDWMIRIGSLQHYAAAITELVNHKVEGGKQLEAFSVQLVVLATWKQALQICHTHAASAVVGSPTKETTKTETPLDVCSEIEGAFLHEVGRAEELAKLIEPGNMEMPDAMELLYQSALALGKHGAVDEYMGDIESAVVFYSKAARLLMFLLVEAPCLVLNPPFSLTNSERYRVKTYIDVLNNRQSVSRSQRMAILKSEKC